MIKIAVDTMGGDNGAKVIVEAIKNFIKDNNDVELTAFGDETELKELEGVCKVVATSQVVPMEAGPMEVLRLKDSSMVKAINFVKDNNYDAVISCGSTGGFLSALTLIIKNIPGVKRSALVAPFPTAIKGKKTVILDVGANLVNTPEELAQFGFMGSLYAKSVLGVVTPKVFLLNNGTEEGKGTQPIKEAYQLLKDDKKVSFAGNIEARHVLDGEADVVVCDGFNGNIFLKGAEGTAKLMSNLIKKAFKRNIVSKIGYLFVRKGIKEMSETMDYKSTGGAMFLGINTIAVKAHGNSDAYSFGCAMNIAKRMVQSNVVNDIKEGVKNA